jgi:hypothetical protein
LQGSKVEQSEQPEIPWAGKGSVREDSLEEEEEEEKGRGRRRRRISLLPEILCPG